MSDAVEKRTETVKTFWQLVTAKQVVRQNLVIEPVVWSCFIAEF